MALSAACRPALAAAALSIAGVDPEHGFAGGETQVLGLTLELIAMGHRAELLCDPTGDLWRRASAAGVVCHPLPIRNALDLRAALALRKRLRAGRYDVVHFHTSRAHAMAPWVRGCVRAAVVTRRMDYVPNRLFARWLYGRAVDGVAAISTKVIEALMRASVPRERITLIPSGVDCVRFRPPSSEERAVARAALAIDDADVAIGVVGALEARKGHRYLLEAISLLKGGNQGAARATAVHDAPPPDAGDERSQPTVRAFIAGDGALRDELAAEISRRGLGDTVRMLGRVEDVRAMLWALDVFVMPSLSEGLGVALLEAMACGVTAAASRVGGIVDAVEEARTGMLAAPGDADALASALQELITDAPRRRTMGVAARERAAERFSMTAMALRTVELYRACLQTVASKSRRKG
jgi:glycosyltransferase involved in cell wall biosynthesis